MPWNPAASDLTVEIAWCGTLHFHPTKQGLLSRPPPPDLGRLLDFKVCPRPALPRGFGGRNRPGLFLEVPQDAVRHPHLCLLPSTLIKPLMPFHLQHTGCIYKNYKTSMKVFNALWSLRGSSYSLHILLSNKNESVVIKSINNYIYIFVLFIGSAYTPLMDLFFCKTQNLKKNKIIMFLFIQFTPVSSWN